MRRKRSNSRRRSAADQIEQPSTMALTSVTLVLLTFFLFLNSIAVPHRDKEEKALGSIEKRFVRTQAEPPPAPQPAPRIELAASLLGTSFASRVSAVRSLAEAGGAETENADDALRIMLPSDRLYADGTDQLRAGFLPPLTSIARQAAKSGLRISIESHTSGEGQDALTLLELSALQAASLYRLFLDLGVPAASLEARGFGGTNPRFSASTPESRDKNRRVELVIRDAAESGGRHES